MPKFHHVKKSYCSHFTTKNSMVCKFRRLWKRLAAVILRWELAPFTLFSILWKRKGLSNPAGEMKGVKNEVEQDGAITNLQVAALQLLKPSSLSVLIYLLGSPVSGTVGTEIEDNDWELAIKEIQLKTQHLDVITSLKSEEVIKVVEELKAQKVLNDLEDLVENLEKFSKLNKRLRKYKKSDPAETWASRWIASPIAYLFPPERREEWLGRGFVRSELGDAAQRLSSLAC